ncbi:MAG: hypothetical protein P4L22_01820 [Candidatus Babeliales bacterium]|nr:hypothetical protein [Candidatus Babeliales bacterium]
MKKMQRLLLLGIMLCQIYSAYSSESKSDKQSKKTDSMICIKAEITERNINQIYLGAKKANNTAVMTLIACIYADMIEQDQSNFFNMSSIQKRATELPADLLLLVASQYHLKFGEHLYLDDEI